MSVAARTGSARAVAMYFVAAIEPGRNADDDAWQDPEFLERLARDAILVTVTDGQHVSLDVKLSAR